MTCCVESLPTTQSVGAPKQTAAHTPRVPDVPKRMSPFVDMLVSVSWNAMTPGAMHASSEIAGHSLPFSDPIAAAESVSDRGFEGAREAPLTNLPVRIELALILPEKDVRVLAQLVRLVPHLLLDVQPLQVARDQAVKIPCSPRESVLRALEQLVPRPPPSGAAARRAHLLHPAARLRALPLTAPKPSAAGPLPSAPAATAAGPGPSNPPVPTVARPRRPLRAPPRRAPPAKPPPRWRRLLPSSPPWDPFGLGLGFFPSSQLQE